MRDNLTANRPDFNRGPIKVLRMNPSTKFGFDFVASAGSHHQRGMVHVCNGHDWPSATAREWNASKGFLLRRA